MQMLSLLIAGSWVALALGVVRGDDPATRPASVLDHTVKDIAGTDYDLAQHRGQVVLIVNVASKCGHTPQYKGLEDLYLKYKGQGLVVIGFPANNFGGQEPGTDAEILAFCTGQYNVTFPMMSKISVKGDDQAPVYRFLTEERTAGTFAGPIAWNFTKFLIGRDGRIVGRFAPKIKPDDEQVVEQIRKALEEAKADGASAREP